MPVHDWTRVPAGIFHDFHHSWIEELKRALNRGLLPPDYYALAEQITAERQPDVLTLQLQEGGNGKRHAPARSGGAVALATCPPKVWFQAKAEIDIYATKAKAVAIRHISDHRVVALVEIVSPGNKSSRQSRAAFVEKAVEMIRGGVHQVIVDLFPASSRDPQGIHKAIWDEIIDNDFALPPDRRLTVASYIGGAIPEALLEPTALALELPEMPLFLNPREYVPLPLNATYESAWQTVPTYWQDKLQDRTSA
jgi:hypothetical protein